MVMRHIHVKITAISLIALLLINFSAGAYAVGGYGGGYSYSGDFMYRVVNGAAEITIYNGKAEYLIIPDELDGYTVAGIGAAAFLLCRSLKLVTIPQSVVSIGAQAFDSCENMQSVNIPESVTSIGDRAFTKCTSLETITIPVGAATGKLAFLECAGLTEASVYSRTIGIGMFANCTALKSIYFGENVRQIGEEAFFNCKSLTFVSFPESVAGIGDGAFFGCSGIKDLVFNSAGTNFEGNLKNIHKYDNIVPTFSEASGLSTVYAFEGSLAHRYAIENDLDFVPLISVLLNGRRLRLETPPIIVNDRALVPMRAIFEALGASVDWDDKTRTVYAVSEAKADAPSVTVSLRIGDPIMTVNGAAVTLEAPPEIYFDRTLVPVRAISESLGAAVEWFEDPRSVVITIE